MIYIAAEGRVFSVFAPWGTRKHDVTHALFYVQKISIPAERQENLPFICFRTFREASLFMGWGDEK